MKKYGFGPILSIDRKPEPVIIILTLSLKPTNISCEYFMSSSQEQFPLCPHFERCAGCTELLSKKPPPIWDEVLSFFSPITLSLPHFHADSPIHWRHRAKVAVRGTVSAPLIGLFERSSHRVLPIPQCFVHHPRLNDAFLLVQEWMKKNQIIPYEENKKTGELRYLQGVVHRPTGTVQLSLVLNFPSGQLTMKQTNRFRFLIEQLITETPLLWHSLWINHNDSPFNTIFGEHWIQISGEELLWEKFGDVEVCYGPESFGQANLPLFEQMLHRIRELIPFQSRLAEFYAGVGVIGLFVASHCEWVRCSEVNPFAEKYFFHSCERLASEISSRLSFTSRSTESSLSILRDATTVIVDPPRKGLDRCFFQALKKVSTIRQLLYISCGWEAFKKDCAELCDAGWVIESVDGYHFFPGSHHVELLVNFERSQ